MRAWLSFLMKILSIFEIAFHESYPAKYQASQPILIYYNNNNKKKVFCVMRDVLGANKYFPLMVL